MMLHLLPLDLVDQCNPDLGDDLGSSRRTTVTAARKRDDISVCGLDHQDGADNPSSKRDGVVSSLYGNLPGIHHRQT